MISYLPILIIAIIAILVYFIIDYRKKVVYNKYLDIHATLDFNLSNNKGPKNNYGYLLFNVSEIRKEARALCIDTIKLNNNKVKVRSLNVVSTKLPLPPDGVLLSVGVKKLKSFNSIGANKCSVNISGYLLEDRNSKIAFKKTIPVAILENSN